MSASNTDKFRKGFYGSATSLSGSIGNTDTTIPLNSTIGLPTDTGIDIVIDRVDASGTKTPTKQETLTVVISGNNGINALRGVEGTAQAHSSGAIVEVLYTAATHNDTINGILQDHDQQGRAKQLTDTNGATILGLSPVASAVNFPELSNAATGNDPIIGVGGTDTARNLNLRGKGLGKTVTIGAAALPVFAYDFVASGLVLSGTGYGSTLGWSMTSGVVVINGNPITVAAASGNVTANKDTYFDVLDNGDGTGLLVNTGANIIANNTISPALAANSIRIGIIVSGANIAAATSVNQGQETMVLPIVSSVAYSVTDGLGNLICPRDPMRRILGYRQILSTFTTTSGAAAQVTGLSVPVIVPFGRKVKIVLGGLSQYQGAANTNTATSIWDGTVGGIQLGAANSTSPTTNAQGSAMVEALVTPTSSNKTYNAGLINSGGSSASLNCTAGAPAYLRVELS